MRNSTTLKLRAVSLLSIFALLLAACCSVHAASSPALQSLFDSAGVFFNFSSSNPYHQAQWSASPSGQPNCGIIKFDAADDAMDLSDENNYWPYQSRFPTPEWYLPIPSSCNPSLSACPLMSGYGMPSPGWSIAVWISIQSFEGSAHLFSALEGGFTLRFSVNSDTRVLELSTSNHEDATPITCNGTMAIPLVSWTLVAVTQWNRTTVSSSNAQTYFFVNGLLDCNCTAIPYWDSPLQPKSNVYIGYDALQESAVLHAQLALWSFWYRPLTSTEHALIGSEDPLSIAGALQMSFFPSPESGTPLLGNNPKTISVVPMTKIRGDSTFTLCLSSVPAGGASPNCFTWYSGQLLQSAVFSMTNPGAGSVSFTWSASFSGTNLPPGTDNSYWLSMFILPPTMNFDRQAPWSQIDSTLSLWKTNIGARPATPPDTWVYNPGAVASSGIIYMNMFWSWRMCYIDQQARNFADTGVTTLPPAQLHPRRLGFSFSMFVNVTSIQWLDSYYADIWHTSWKYSDGGARLVNFSIGLKPNYSMHINIDACHAYIGDQNALQAYQWELLTITQSESGWLKVYWNAALAYSAQCGGLMNRYTGTTVTMARLGPDPHGSQRMVDSIYWPVRMEVASMQYFNRELVQEEIALNLRTPPASINTFPFPLKAITLPPYVLPQGEKFVLGVYPSSYFGGVVNLYVRASVANCFPNNYNGALDGYSCPGSCGRLQWDPYAMIGQSLVKTMDIVMPLSSGCVTFDSWVSGDTARYAKLQIDSWKICAPDWNYIVAQANVTYPMKQPPAAASWLDKSGGSGNGAGVVVLRSSTTDMLRIANPGRPLDGALDAAADGAVGSTASRQKVDTTGYTIMINLQQLKYNCNQFIWNNDYFRLYLYCSGYLLFQQYNGGWNDYGYCALNAIQARLGEYMWIAASFNPASNNMHIYGHRGTGGGDNYEHYETHCWTTPQFDNLVSKIGFGYDATFYTPDVHLSHALWFDKHLTEYEFKLIAQNLVPLAFVNGQFPLSLSTVPLTCPPSQSVSLTVSFPHRYGGLVHVDVVTSPTPGLASPSRLTFDPSVLPWVGSKSFTVGCPPPGTTHVAFVLSGDTTHFYMNKDFDLIYADPGAYAIMQLKPALMSPPNAVLNGAQATVQFNGFSNWVDLNTLAGSGVTPAYSGGTLTIPEYMLSPPSGSDAGRLHGDGWTVEGWYQPTSLAHSHSLLSCGAAAIPDRGLPSIHLTIANQDDYGYGLSYQQLNSWPFYSSIWWTDQCNAHTRITQPMPHQWMHWAIVWMSSVVYLYVDGVLLHAFECPSIYRASRPSCYSGRDHFEQRYSQGRLAALNIYDWPLASHEILLTSNTIRPAWAPFTTAPDYPTKMKIGVPVDLTVFTPWRKAAAVTLVLTASIAGVLPSNPYTMSWGANDNAVRRVTTQMPAGQTTFTLNFATSDNARFTAPPSLTVTTFTTAGLLAEAAQTIPVTAAQHPSQPPFIPHPLVPSKGTVRLSGTQYINWNAAADTGNGAVLDPLLITKGSGFTAAMWFKLETMQIDNYLFSAWKSGTPERAYVLRTEGDCLMLRYSDLQSWYDYPWGQDNIYSGFGQYKFACGSWQTGVWMFLMWIYAPQESSFVNGAALFDAMVNRVFLNNQIVGQVKGGRGEWGNFDNWRIGAPAPADLYRFTYNAESVRYWGICKIAYELWGGQPALDYCALQLTVWRWANTTSGMQGEFAGGSFWARPLNVWEVRELWLLPPPALSPAVFASTNPRFLSIGWGCSDSFGLAVPMDFNTHPIITPRIYGPDDDTVDYVLLSPPIDVPIDMSLYPWSPAAPQGMLNFTVTAKAFPNTISSYSAPDLYIRFELSGDTVNFIQPADISLSPTKLLASGTFNLGTQAISQHAKWAVGVTDNTGYHVFPPSSSGGGFTSLPYLNILKTRDSLTSAAGVWPDVQKSWAGFTVLTWLKIELPNANIPAVIFWTGDVYKPGKSDVLFEVATPLRRLRLRFFNNSFISRPVLDCRSSTIDVPLNRWLQVGFTVDQQNTTLWQSGFPVSSCTFTRGGGGPKGIGEVSRSGTWLGRSANFGGQMFGGFASFTSFDRALTAGEIASLASTPPRNIGVRNISVSYDTTFQMSTLAQVSVITVTPGMETTLGLVMVPTVYSPVWYNTSEMQFFTTVYSDALFTSPKTANLNFPPLAPNAASSKYMTIGWTGLVPYVIVDFNSSDVAHYTFPRNFTIMNPLPDRLMATGLFVLGTRSPSVSVGWMAAPSIAVAEGIVVMNSTTALQSLDLHAVADTGSPLAPSALIMPNTVGTTGFSMQSWVKLTRPTASQLATTPVVRWISWRDSSASNDDGVWAQINHSTSKITFGAALSTNAQSCSCTSAGQVSYDLWVPIIFVWSATGSMQVYVGDLKANYFASSCTCTDVGFGKYPVLATVRDSCRLGRLAGPADPASVAPWQLASFAYFDYPFTATQSKILLYHAPPNISPSGWVRSPETVMSNSFLNAQFSYTLWPSSYSTLSGNVTVVPRLGGAGSVSPTSITFSDRAPRTFVFTTPLQNTLWTVTFDIYGDTFFFAHPPGFTIDCAAGLFSVVTVPSNMLPNQAVTIAITPNAYIGSDLSMTIKLNGVNAVTDTNAQVQISPLSFSWGAQDNTVRYLTLSTHAALGTALLFNFDSTIDGTDGINFLSPPATNVTISNTAHVLFSNVPTSMYTGALLLVPISILPGTVPPAGFAMSLSSDLGVSVLNGITNINFPAGSIATTLLTLDTRSITIAGTSATLTLSFGITGADSSTFVTPNPISIEIQKPQPITMLAPASVLTFMYANQQLTFTFLPSVTPLFNVTLIATLTRCTFYPVPTGGASPNTTVMLFKSAPLTSKTFTIVAPASPVDTTLQVNFAFAGYDLQHFILPPAVNLVVLAQSQIILLNGASIPPRIHVNDTLSLQVTVSKPPLNGATDNLYLLCDCGVVTPAYFPLTSANYATVQTFNFQAPSGFAEQCKFDVRVVGPNAGYYAQAPTPVFDVLGYFVLISVPPPLLFLGQFSPVLIMETRGINPPPDIQLIAKSTGTGALFDPTIIQFTPASVQGTFTYSAPFFLPVGVTAVTVSFVIEGGLDADKLDLPAEINYNVKLLDLAAFQWMARPNSASQPAFHDTPFPIHPPNFGATLAKQTLSIPYAFSSVEIKAVTVTPNTVFFKLADGLISDENSPLLSGTKAALPPTGFIIDLVLHPTVTMLVDSQKDGFTYLIMCQRMPPVALSLQVYPSLANDLRGLLGRIWTITPASLASGTAAMAASLTFNSGIDEHYMTMTLPWSTTSLTFHVTSTTDFTSYLSFNPNLVPGPQDTFGNALYSPWLMVDDVGNQTNSLVFEMSNGVEAIFPNLIAGQSSLFLLNHTLDGLYVFNVLRLPPPITSLALTFGRTPLQSGFESAPALSAYPFVPDFVPETYAYSVTVPWVISLVYLNMSMNFPSMPVTVAPSSQSATLLNNVMSAALSLPAAQTYVFTVTTPQDGTWNWSIARQLAHVTSFTLTAYDALARTNPLSLVPAFALGRFDYTATLPFGTQAATVACTTDARVGVVSIDNGGLPLPLTLYTNNLLRLNDSLDGAYTFTLLYSTPDLLYLCMSSRGLTLLSAAGCNQGSSGLFVGESTGCTSGATSKAWGSATRSYSFAVPYIMTLIDVRTAMNTTHTVTMERMTTAPVSLTNAAPTASFALMLGINLFALNSTLDGYYRLTVSRCAPDVANIVVAPLTNSPGCPILPAVPFSSPYAPETFSYPLSVPFVVGSVQLVVTFSTVGSVRQWVGATRQDNDLTSGVASPPVLLPAGVTTVITLVSLQDGNYSVSVWRELAHQTAFTLTAYDQYAGTNALALLPGFSRGRYSYDLFVPYGTQRVGVQWTADARVSTVSIDNGGMPLPLTLYTTNLLRLNDSLDGAYAFTLLYSPPNITHVCMSSRGRTIVHDTGCAQQGATGLYAGEATGATVGQAALTWKAVQRSYAITLPFIMTSLDARILRASVHTLTLERSPLVPIAYTAALTDASFSLLVGVNRFNLNSTLDGYYTFLVTRASPDVLSLLCVPLTNGVALAAAALSPPFAGQTLSYLISVPFATNVVQITASFATVGSVRLIVPSSGLERALVSGVNSSLILLPGGAAALGVTVESLATGNYSLLITRTQIGAVANPGLTLVHPPTQVSVGDAIVLTSLLTSSDPLTDISALSYRWRCLSHPSLDLADALLTVFPPVNASALALRPDAIAAAGDYTIELTVTDPDSTHRTTAGLVPTARVTASISVIPSVSLSVTQSAANADPCAQSPCMNGGQCVATASVSVANAFTLSCRCPSSSISFHGPICSFAIVTCLGCISSYTGGAVVTLFGVGMHNVRSLTVDGRSVAFRSPVLRNASWSDDVRSAIDRMRQFNPAVTEVHELALITPALVERRNATTGAIISGRRLLSTDAFLDPSFGANNSIPLLTNPISAYQPVTLTAVLTGSSAPTQLNYSSLLFYSSSSCIAAGTWRDDGAGGCLACPVGGYCPGGGRVWPLAGYWSYSEFQPPIACLIPEACPGVDPRLIVTLSTGTQTQLCDSAYDGPRCGQCSQDFYQLNGRCFFCGSVVDQTRDVAITILSALIAMCVLALAVAFLQSRRLAYTMQAFVVLQSVAMIGVQGVKHSPFASEQLSIAFTWSEHEHGWTALWAGTVPGALICALVASSLHGMMDIEILRPGCGGIPSLSYVRKYTLTLLFMLLSAVLFFLACLLRLCLNVRRRRIDPQQSYAEEVLVDEDEADDAPVANGRPKATRLVSVVRRVMHPQLTWRQRVSQFRRSPEWHDASQRLQHSWLILGAIFFLRINILSLKSFLCEMAPDPMSSFASDAPITQSLLLSEDLQTRCFVGTHLVTIVFVSCLLLCYSLGFPLFCFVLLMRSFATPRTPGMLGWLRQRFRFLQGKKKKSRRKGIMMTTAKIGPTQAGATHKPHGSAPSALVAFGAMSKSMRNASAAVESSADSAEPTPQQVHMDRINRFGYLFSGYRYSHFAGCMLVFALQLVVACVTVLIPDERALQKLFAFGLVWTTHTLVMAIELPFEAWSANARKIIIGLATLAHSTVLLALQTDASKSTFLYVLLTLFSALVILLLVRRRLGRWCGCALNKKQARPKLARTKTVAPQPIVASGLEGAMGAPDDSDEDEDDDEIEAHNEWLTQGEETVEAISPAAVPDVVPPALLRQNPETEVAALSDAVSPMGAVPVEFADLPSPSARLDSPSALLSRDVHLRVVSPRAELPQAVEESPLPAPSPVESPIVDLSTLSAPAPMEVVPPSFTAALRTSLPPIPCMLATLCRQFELHPTSSCLQSDARWTSVTTLPSESELLHVIELSLKEYSYGVDSMIAHLMMHRRRQIDSASVSSTIMQGQLQALQLEWKAVGSRVNRATNADPATTSAALSSESFLAPLFAARADHSPIDSASSASVSYPSSAAVRACVRSLLSHPRAAIFLQQLVAEARDLALMWSQIDHLCALEQQAAAMVAPSELECILAQASAEEVTLAGDPATGSGLSLGATLQSLRFAARALVQARMQAAEDSKDSGQREHFAKLYAALVDEHTAIHAHTHSEMDKAEEILAAKLKKGKTEAQCRVLDLALSDPSLRVAFQLDVETKEQQIAEAFSQLRANESATIQSESQSKRKLPLRLPAVASSFAASSSSATASLPPLRLTLPRGLRPGHVRGSTQVHVRVPTVISNQQADETRLAQARFEAEDEQPVQNTPRSNEHADSMRSPATNVPSLLQPTQPARLVIESAADSSVLRIPSSSVELPGAAVASPLPSVAAGPEHSPAHPDPAPTISSCTPPPLASELQLQSSTSVPADAAPSSVAALALHPLETASLVVVVPDSVRSALLVDRARALQSEDAGSADQLHFTYSAGQ